MKWFDGFDGQEAAVIDDFRGDFCTFHFLLRLLDRYPLKVAIKGGFMEWTPSRIFITSPHHPRDVYNKTDEEIKQLTRRITQITHFTDNAFNPINID